MRETTRDTSVDEAWGVVRALAPYFRPYRPQVALIAVGLMLETAFNAAFPLSLKILIDVSLIDRDRRVLVTVLAVLGGGVVVVSLAALARDYLYARVSS